MANEFPETHYARVKTLGERMAEARWLEAFWYYDGRFDADWTSSGREKIAQFHHALAALSNPRHEEEATFQLHNLIKELFQQPAFPPEKLPSLYTAITTIYQPMAAELK